MVSTTVSGTATRYTVPLASCATSYEFRVRAPGNGTDYVTAWSPYSDSARYVMKTCPV